MRRVQAQTECLAQSLLRARLAPLPGSRERTARLESNEIGLLRHVFCLLRGGSRWHLELNMAYLKMSDRLQHADPFASSGADAGRATV